ncbi:hypothetical protein PCI56_17165 [Plesiomonas shigelloides subsp. oncorhynchi]|nr:hypothetical protein [Plesiomonas shigelloides]
MGYLDVSGVVRKAVIVTHIIIGLNVGGAELMLKRLIESHRERPDIEHSIISLTDMGVLGEHSSSLSKVLLFIAWACPQS